MLFLAGKGDNTVGFYEVIDRDPFLTEGLRHTGQQSKGACLVPKRALRVMEGEVNRVLQLTANSVIPVSYIVPRKVIIIINALNSFDFSFRFFFLSPITNFMPICSLKRSVLKRPFTLVSG